MLGMKWQMQAFFLSQPHSDLLREMLRGCLHMWAVLEIFVRSGSVCPGGTEGLTYLLFPP